MNLLVVAAGHQNVPGISPGSKAGAILIGVAFLAIVYIITAFITGHWQPKALFNGFDGFASTSKLQWLLWLIVILFGYVAVWVLRAEHGDYTALSDTGEHAGCQLPDCIQRTCAPLALGRDYTKGCATRAVHCPSGGLARFLFTAQSGKPIVGRGCLAEGLEKASRSGIGR